MEKSETFSLVMVGVGGQGLITMLRIISEAAFLSGFDVKTSEIHGLSQRGGSVEVHARFAPRKGLAKKPKDLVFSPLVRQGAADLIVALDVQEAQRACFYASRKETVFLINDFFAGVIGKKPLSKSSVFKNIKGFSKKNIVIPASSVCKEKVGTPLTAGIFLLSLASFNGFLPIKPPFILEAMEEVIPRKYLEINKETFNLSESYL